MLTRHIGRTHRAVLFLPSRPQTGIPRISLTRTSSKYALLETGEKKSGHISAGPNEGVLYLSNLFPLNIQWFFRLPWVSGQRFLPRLLNSGVAANPVSLFRDAQKNDPVNGQTAEIVEVLPRIKEGGAFVKFTHGPDATPLSIQTAVSKYLKEKGIRPWSAPLLSVRAGLVMGKPWVEDLYRLPSARLKVEFLPPAPEETAAELSQEQLYAFFRPYGKLADIVTQPPDSKVVPRFAYLDYTNFRKAVMAKNCMHGYTVDEGHGGGKPGTVLRLTYEKKQKTRWFWDWLSNHPRLVIPALAALIAGLSVTIFDPIRTLFIKAHITRALHLEDNRLWRWFKAQTEDLLTKVRLRNGDNESAGMSIIWEDRKDNITQIRTWLMETTDTFIVVQGPRGSGKRELVVDQALKGRKNTLILDCKPIQEARGDAKTIDAAAGEVGYRPVFSWTNSISGLVDLAAQGATGVKTGFSETLENQLSKIWSNTATALKQLALEGRKKDDKDANLGDDEYLEAHPERRPVVVIDNFLHKSQEGGIVYDKLAEWAASVTTSNIAHVIYLTHDVSFSKSLSKALPDRVFREISLSDCSEEVAKRYVVNHLDFDTSDTDEGFSKLTPSQRRKDLHELDDVLPVLGGRLTDLEFLARRIKAGETPKKSAREIVDQSASEILKMFLSAGPGAGSDEKREFTASQAWVLVKQLAEADHGSLRYNEVLLNPMYGGGADRALAALEQVELISIQSSAGRPYAIKPGRPVYAAAFRKLVDDKVLRSRMDLAVLGECIKQESASIDKAEQELHLLGELPKQPAELNARVQWLLGKIMTSQTKVENWEREQTALKKILTSEY